MSNIADVELARGDVEVCDQRLLNAVDEVSYSRAKLADALCVQNKAENERSDAKKTLRTVLRNQIGS